MDEQPEITFYRDDDLVLAFCGTWGADGVYRCWLDDDPEKIQWEFIPPESKSWDAYHQKVFRQHHAEACGEDVQARLPPLPDIFPPPSDYHAIEKAAQKSIKPARWVLQAVQAAPAGRLAVFVVLSEDRYESVFGDGVFRYFEAAFADAEVARTVVTECSARVGKETEAKGDSFQWATAYHLRHVHLTHLGDEVTLETEGAEDMAEESKVSPFDHFTVEQVCDDLARRLG